MSDEILQKLKEHDKRFDKIDQRLDGHDEQLEVIAQTVVDNQRQLGGVESRLDRLEQTTDNVVTRLVTVDGRFDRIEEIMATKEDVGRIMNTLDTLVGLHRKTEQELVFMGEQVRRNNEDITKIRPLVGLEAVS